MASRQRIDELSLALLELVRGRNRCLESLARAAETFLAAVNRPSAAPADATPGADTTSEGNPPSSAAPDESPAFQRNLDAYSARRDAGIRSYVLFDRHASETAAKLGESRTPSRDDGSNRDLQGPVKAAIEVEIERTSTLVALNAEYDARVVARIEEEKQKILNEARRTRRSRDRLARFRSEWVPATGDEVDRKL